ncbi:MAG: galactokinase [Planctomycetales bacterium]|nr:galactokinase [Planctomycetales bacterium]
MRPAQNVPLNQLAARATNLCREKYGVEPQWMSVAPGRVNLIGEHVDYNDGLVLPMAIERFTVVAGGLSSHANVAEFYAEQVDESFTVDLTSDITPTEPAWSNYVRGVLSGFHDRGVTIPALAAVIVSTVPVGSGLSSSAALEVATAAFLQSATAELLAPTEMALLCQKAEHDFAGVPCGIMDQFSSVFGKQDSLVQIDCRSMGVTHIPFDSSGHSILIINSNVKHELSGGEYAHRRSQCESAARKLCVPSLRDVTIEGLQKRKSELSDVEFLRARHVVTEIGRVIETSSALNCSDWSRVGELMYASHESLKQDFDVSCSELDLLVDFAKDAGAIGARMTGGGFGGCTVNLVENAQADSVFGQVLAGYRDATGIEADGFVTRPADGACVLA